MEFYIQLMSYDHSSKEDLGETAAHEMMLHGYKVGTLIREFLKGGKKAVEAELKNDPGGKKDHTALKTKDINHKGYQAYTSIKKQLIALQKSQPINKYEQEFKKEEKGNTNK